MSIGSGDKRAAKKWREKVESQASTINCFFSNNNGTSFHLTSLGNILPLSLCPSPPPLLFPIDMCRIFLPTFSSHCTLHSAHCVCAQQQQQCLSINQLPPPPVQQNCSETCPHHLASSSSTHSMLQPFFQHYFYYYTTWHRFAVGFSISNNITDRFTNYCAQLTHLLGVLLLQLCVCNSTHSSKQDWLTAWLEANKQNLPLSLVFPFNYGTFFSPLLFFSRLHRKRFVSRLGVIVRRCRRLLLTVCLSQTCFRFLLCYDKTTLK